MSHKTACTDETQTSEANPEPPVFETQTDGDDRLTDEDLEAISAGAGSDTRPSVHKQWQ